MECDKCGSVDFHEQDGFYFCIHCQTQSQGFAKEVADDDEFHIAREVKTKTRKSKNGEKKDKSVRGGFSRWSTVEAFNIVFTSFIDDLFDILEHNNLKASKSPFVTVAMQLWFKYLRESEIAFLRNEHLSSSKNKLHPATRYRDNFLFNTPSSSEPLPLYHRNVGRKNNCYSSYNHGNSYAGRTSTKLLSSNASYLNDDTQSTKYKDPRNYIKRLKTCSKKREMPYSRKFNQLLIENSLEQDNYDPFVNLINDIVNVKNVKLPTEENCDNIDTDQDTKGSSEVFLDKSNYDSVLEDRMSFKCKLFREHISLEKFKDNVSRVSPLANDLIDRYKTLAFLYLTIRMLNYNIYLSDIIRWCYEGNIRFMNVMSCLPKDWEIMWIDLNMFRSNNFPAYHYLTQIIGNMVIHCNIDQKYFPTPNIEHLIKRFIKDLNLPKGLFLVVMKKYSNFIEYAIQHENAKFFPKYDLIAISSIIMSLRDLFDLNGTTEFNFNLFSNNQQFDNLFLWSKWFEYSKLRLTMIKMFNINIRVKYNSELINIDEIMVRNKDINFFYTEKKQFAAIYDVPNTSRQMSLRYILQDNFANLFFCEKNHLWNEKINLLRAQKTPSLYPLTSKTEQVLSQISNTKIKNILNKDFRKQLITPYMCNENLSFHRKCILFNSKTRFVVSNWDFFENCSPSIQHLIELASIITCADMTKNMEFFILAEKFLLES